GRMLACRMWSGGTLDAPPSAEVKGLIDDALRVAKRAKDETLKDDPSMRHAEAEFLIGLRSNWLGLRQETATTAHQASRFGDAAICLAQDDLNLMRRAADAYYFDATPALMHPLQEKYEPNMPWLYDIRKLRKSGQLADIHAESRRVFELPLIELSKMGTDIDRDRLARFYLLSGDAQKALDVVSAGSGALAHVRRCIWWTLFALWGIFIESSRCCGSIGILLINPEIGWSDF
ncbi:MAG: hypothetical protein NTV80_01125, partial [Verrucomicrobia bacterium]|nr:hypothetical protein [Verrucomicrobiota bacterium]